MIIIDVISIIFREKKAPFRRSRQPMTIALIPNDDWENEITSHITKHSAADFFFDYVRNGGKALIRRKRARLQTRAVRPTKRYNISIRPSFRYIKYNKD